MYNGISRKGLVYLTTFSIGTQEGIPQGESRDHSYTIGFKNHTKQE